MLQAGRGSSWLFAICAAAGYLVITCASAVLGLVGWQKGNWRWVRITAILELPLFPVGTIPAIVALVFLARIPQTARQPALSVNRVAGDGTGALGPLLVSLPFLLALLAASFFRPWAEDRGLASPGLVWMLAALVSAIVVNVFVHECGHLAAGWLMGFRLYHFRVDPLSLLQRDGQWIWEIRKPYFAMSGLCAMAPDTLLDLRKRMALFILGGPAASLLLGLSGVAMFFGAPRSPWQEWWLFFQFTGLLGLSTFVANLIPTRVGQYYSDGARVYQFARGGGWSDQLLATSMAAISAHAETRPRDWNTDIMERAAAFESAPLEYGTALLLVYTMYADRRDMELAGPHYRKLKEVLSRMNPEMASPFAPSLAFHEAYHARNAAEARQWFERMPRELDFNRKLVEAAVLWCEGEAEQAASAWAEAAALAKKLPRAGSYAAGVAALEALGERMKETAPVR